MSSLGPEFWSSMPGYFWVKISHEVALRCWLEWGHLKSSFTHVWYLGWKASKSWNSWSSSCLCLFLCVVLLLISPAWRLQSRQLSYTVTCRLKSPKPYILSDREPGGSQITFHDLAWKSQNTISPTLLADTDAKLHLISGEETSTSPSNGEVSSS